MSRMDGKKTHTHTHACMHKCIPGTVLRSFSGVCIVFSSFYFFCGFYVFVLFFVLSLELFCSSSSDIFNSPADHVPYWQQSRMYTITSGYAMVDARSVTNKGLVPAPSETCWFRGMSVGGSFRRV